MISVKTEYDLMKYIETQEKIILYGPGMVGGLVKERLDFWGYSNRILYFAKTKVNHLEFYKEILVREISLADCEEENTIVLVCGIEKTRREMIRELEVAGINNYIPITETLFSDLESNYLRAKNVEVEQEYDVVFFSQDNNSTSGAFISMVGLCEEIRKQSGLRLLIVLQRYGDGEKLLQEKRIDYTYAISTHGWIKPKESLNGQISPDEYELEMVVDILKRTRAKLVHMSGMFVYLGAVAAKKLDIPFIWHIRENIITQGNDFIDPVWSYNLINSSKCIIGVSQHALNAYEGLCANITQVIYNGADNGVFYLERNIFEADCCHIVMVGHITKLKGQEILVEALNMIKQNDDVIPRVTFVGSGESNYLEYIKRKIQDYGLNEYITFVGRTLNPEKYYQQADIAVSATSGGEGFDRVRIEAMMSGCLLLTNDMGAAREIVDDGVTGYVYQDGNAKQLAQIIMQCIHNKEVSLKIAKAGQKLCTKEFSKRHNAEEVLKIYRRILGNNYGR